MGASDPVGRRAFLAKSAALGAILAAPPGFVAACTSGDGSGSSTSTTAGSSALDSLAAEIDGTLLVPGDAAFDLAAAPHNAAVNQGPPQAVLLAASGDDVARGITFATEQEMPFTARSGGHSYAGYSTTEGLQISLSQLSDVVVDRSTDRAIIGAGANLATVYRECAAAGYSIPGGSCPTVGIAGLTLGGGFGFTGRQHGVLCDSLVGATMVTAAGEEITASADENADLYWALRGGGGGNFGIVTALEFDVYPVDEVGVAQLFWSWSEAAEAFDAWQRLGPSAPSELTTNIILANSGSGDDTSDLTVFVNAVYLGGADELRELLDPLYQAAGEPDDSSSIPEDMTWLDTVWHLAGCTGYQVCQQVPLGNQPQQYAYYKSGYASETYDSDAVDLLVSSLESWPGTSQGGVLEFDAYGGAINEVAPDATAFVHRDQRFLGQYQAYWDEGDSDSEIDAAKGWLRDFGEAIAPHNSGFAYQNYIDPELEDWEQAYYGDNFDRLVSVKAQYDPDDVFSFAQSIPTST